MLCMLSKIFRRRHAGMYGLMMPCTLLTQMNVSSAGEEILDEEVPAEESVDEEFLVREEESSVEEVVVEEFLVSDEEVPDEEFLDLVEETADEERKLYMD